MLVIYILCHHVAGWIIIIVAVIKWIY
jgi:hypothetical protein